MAEAARAGVNLQDDLTGGDADALRFRLVVHRLDDVHFHEVIARADGAELIVAALLRAVRDEMRGRRLQSPV